MGRVLKLVFYLAVLGALGLVGYAALDELEPPTRAVERELPMPAPAGQ
jgi:hypothetical protein